MFSFFKGLGNDYDGGPSRFDKKDIEDNRVIAALAYIGILFFLPLVVSPDSEFGKFHANQGLLNFLFMVAGNLGGRFIPGLFQWTWSLLTLYPIVIAIIGGIRTLNGEAREIPLVGNCRLIK